MQWLESWPEWVPRLTWTLGTITVFYVLGHLMRAIVGSRLTRLTARTHWRWDDALAAVTSRVPFWAILAGVLVSLRYWSLVPTDHERIAQLVGALAVASVTFALADIASSLLSSYGPRHGQGVPVSALAQNVVRGLIVTLGALVIVRSFGFEITPYLTALGVGGLAVALALQDPLSNFFAGVFMSVSGQIRIGDYLRLEGGSEGYVADFNWRSTSIRLLSDNIVIIPNAKLAQAVVTNFHQPSRELTMVVDVSVHYMSNLADVERITVDVARDVLATIPGGVPSFTPVVRFHTFGANGVIGSVMLRAQEFTDQFLLRHEFIKRLHERYSREGITVPYPPVDPRAIPSNRAQERRPAASDDQRQTPVPRSNAGGHD
jgi:small-conductance mechanosensitive channel